MPPLPSTLLLRPPPRLLQGRVVVPQPSQMLPEDLAAGAVRLQVDTLNGVPLVVVAGPGGLALQDGSAHTPDSTLVEANDVVCASGGLLLGARACAPSCCPRADHVPLLLADALLPAARTRQHPVHRTAAILGLGSTKAAQRGEGLCYFFCKHYSTALPRACRVTISRVCVGARSYSMKQ